MHYDPPEAGWGAEGPPWSQGLAKLHPLLLTHGVSPVGDTPAARIPELGNAADAPPFLFMVRECGHPFGLSVDLRRKYHMQITPKRSSAC
jgi:hypothetical protein